MSQYTSSAELCYSNVPIELKSRFLHSPYHIVTSEEDIIQNNNSNSQQKSYNQSDINNNSNTNNTTKNSNNNIIKDISATGWKNSLERKTRIEQLAEQQVQNMAKRIQANTRPLYPPSSHGHNNSNNNNPYTISAAVPTSTYLFNGAGNHVSSNHTHNHNSNNGFWSGLLEKEEKKTLKYHAHDKTLLILLDEEKMKYAELEQEYNKLLKEVQLLHSAHKREIEQQERRLAAENKSLQKALLLKSEEFNAIQQTLKTHVEKGIREGTDLKTENEDLSIKYKKTKIELENLTERARLQEKVLSDLALKRKQLEKELDSKTNQVNSLLNEKSDKEKHQEKIFAARNVLENQIRVLEKQLTDKEDECLSLKTKLLTLQNDNDKLETVKRNLMEVKVDNEQSKRREKQYLEEFEQAGIRERQLLAETNSLTTQLRRSAQLEERFDQKEKAYLQELDQLKGTQYKLKQELHDSLNKKAHITEELAQANRELKKYISKVTLLQQELSEVKDINDKQARDLISQEEKLRFLSDSEALLKRENEKLTKENDYVRADLKSKDGQLETLRANIDDLRGKLDAESDAKRELKAQAREQYNADQEKISQLQKLLKEATFRVEELNQSEDALKRSVADKEERIEEFQKELSQLENNLVLLQSKLAKQRSDFETVLKQKEDAYSKLLDNHDSEIARWEAEAERLSHQLSQKSKQADILTVRSTEGTTQLEEAKEKILELKTRLNEATAAKTVLVQQVEDKNLAIDAKDQELEILSMKNRSLNDQVLRLEEDISSQRSTSARKDSDLARLQSNVNELSKRLKNQVDMILERDLEYAAHTISNRGGSATPSTSSYSRSPARNSSLYHPPAPIPSSQTREYSDSHTSHRREYSLNSFSDKQITGFDEYF